MSGIYQYMLISPYDKIDNLNQRLEKHKHRKQADQIATILRENPILGFKHSTLSHQHSYNMQMDTKALLQEHKLHLFPLNIEAT